ncbi:hypothetical protein CLV32_3595 [Pedobacter duraquae]|uniref:Uncharacterized protein n=1 Tax=Pedobacter duraquae TaxID=425511 RepID=A0A4R6IGS1_9SPHI|nr:hypothetical protein CLV32_3595 [Pedobacter duraquae]
MSCIEIAQAVGANEKMMKYICLNAENEQNIY